MINSKRRFNRGVVAAQFAALCVVSSSALAAIVDSGPVSITIPNNIDGIYFNVVTGAGATSGGGAAGWDVNLYATGGGLTFFWPSTPAASSGGVADATPLYLPQPAGSVVSAGSTFSVASGGGGDAPFANFRVTGSNNLGIRFFNEATSAINYGYITLETTGATGFPATIRRVVYGNAGEAVTVTGGGPVASAPQFTYTPAAGSTVGFTGGAAIGSTGSASISAAVGTAGSGTGATATTTTTCTPPTAPFAGFGQTITAEGTGAISGGPLSGTCVLGAAAATQTLTCNESRGGTATAVTFTLSCPAGAQANLTPTPASGSTITLSRVLGGSAATGQVSFQNPGAAAATVTCVAPTNTAFTASPLVINVPAGGSASTTVSYTSATAGSQTGTLNCSSGAQQFTYNLSGVTGLPTAEIIPASSTWTLALLATLMSLLAGVFVMRRQD